MTGPYQVDLANRALQVRGLVAGFGGEPVLRGVDLEVMAGTTTAVLGPSGCGKTTLLRAVAGFVRPQAGSVTINGQRVTDARQGAGDRPGRGWVPPERRPIGYVAQEGALFPHLSVADNVSFGLERAQRRDRKATRSRVEEFLELVSLDRRVADHRPSELSGGQQQRVALARALIRQPSLVLLDEPFSALDAGLRTATRTAVKEALASTGVTVVLVTHDQGEALSFADRVALVREGRVVQVDAPAAAYAHPVDRPAAEFLGDAVVLPGTVMAGVARCVLGEISVAATVEDGDVEVVLRPEQLTLRAVGTAGGPPTRDATRLGVVERLDFFGHDALVDVRLVTGEAVRARVIGADLPADGEVVQIEVRGTARTYPRTPALPIA